VQITILGNFEGKGESPMLNRKHVTGEEPTLDDYDSVNEQDLEVTPIGNYAPGDILAQYEDFSNESRGGWETSSVLGQEW